VLLERLLVDPRNLGVGAKLNASDLEAFATFSSETAAVV